MSSTVTGRDEASQPEGAAASQPESAGAGGESALASRGSLEVMLTDAATGPVRRWLPGTAAVQLAAQLTRHPRQPAGRVLGLGSELAKIAVGRSQVAPSAKDGRFKDPAWTHNPLYRRLAQSYLASAQAAEDLVADADLEWRHEQRLSFLVENAVDALAPSNLLINPAALKAALDSGGANFVRGGRQLLRDVRREPHIPEMVDTRPFTVGQNLAATDGAVVLRTPVMELIQYRPRTEQVHATPLLLVPPMINKFYVADLAPGRSMVEFFLDSGQPVFALSWRNPLQEHRDWDLDTYAQAVIDALDGVRQVSGHPRAHLLGLCAGGITASCVVAHLAARGEQDRIASLTLGVTVLDQHHAGTVGALVDRRTADAAVRQSQRRGYLDGRALAGVFAWLRPNDLVWNYWVNNYLLGKSPPAFDVLYWNDDVTRMPAGLHRDFVHLAVENALVTPGKATVLGTPLDLGKITVDTYLVAGIADHITPWQNCYRSTALLGSSPRFLLSTSGHIAALVNPPGNPKASYRVSEELPAKPEQWLAAAHTVPGSWWTDWTSWVGERSGGEIDAPAELGGGGLAPLCTAPGVYVLDR